MTTANLPWVESPFFNELLADKKLPEEKARLAADYNRDGFIVLPGAISHDLIDNVRKDAEDKGFNPDFKIKTQRNEVRVQDLWRVSDAARDLACHPQILETLDFLYGRPAAPFQTLHFKVGSQQRTHSDTIHFSSLPARYMCGAWVALEDVTEESGPVFYYSGSHKLPEYDLSHIRPSANTATYDNYIEYEEFIQRIVAEHKLKKKTFLAKKGDVLIWSSNILHGGSSVSKPGTTRWSQVTHYFFEDCYYYTPMLSNMATRELYLRNRLTDIRTGKRLKLSYNGEKLNKIRTGNRVYMLTNNKGVEGSIIFGRLKQLFDKLIGH